MADLAHGLGEGESAEVSGISIQRGNGNLERAIFRDFIRSDEDDGSSEGLGEGAAGSKTAFGAGFWVEVGDGCGQNFSFKISRLLSK